MSFHSWLQNLRSALAPRRGQSQHRRRGSLRAATFRPDLEVLEDRLTPSLYWGGNYPLSEFDLTEATPATTRSATADFNGDGRSDMVTVNYWTDTVNLLLGNADGTFSDAGIVATGAYSVAVGDFTSNGITDLLVGRLNDLAVLPGHGDGTFGAPIGSSFVPTTMWLAVADFNGDGRLDVFTVEQSDDLGGTFAYQCLGWGDGTFDVQNSFGGIGLDTIGVWTGDFNGDARPDVAVADNDYGGESAEVVVGLNDGNWPDLILPRLQVSGVSVTEGNTGTVSAVFTVALSSASTQQVTVQYATADGTATAGSDYQAATGTLTIPAGQTTGTITVLVKGDRLPEPNETFNLNLSAATNANITDGQGVGTIVDDEPRISISDVSKYEGKKGHTTLFSFTVTLSAAYDQPVTMSFGTVDGTAKTSDQDYVAKTSTLTFAPGETTKTITIEVKGDSKTEADETFYLDVFANSSNSLFTKNRGIGTILNDD